MRHIPDAERLLYLLKDGNKQNLDSVWLNRYLPDGTFVQISSIFGNDVINITSPFVSVVEEVSFIGSLFLAGGSHILPFQFTAENNVIVLTPASTDITYSFVHPTTTTARQSLVVVSNNAHTEHKVTGVRDSLLVYEGGLWVTYTGVDRWNVAATFYGIPTPTCFGSRYYFTPPDTFFNTVGFTGGTPHRVAYGRRNHTLDTDGNLTTYEEEIWFNGYHADGSIKYDLHYKTGGVDSTIDDIYPTVNGVEYDKDSVIVIAAIGNLKTCYDFTEATGSYSETIDGNITSSTLATSYTGKLYFGDVVLGESSGTYQRDQYENYPDGNIVAQTDTVEADETVNVLDWDNINGDEIFIGFLKTSVEADEAHSLILSDADRTDTTTYSYAYSYSLVYWVSGGSAVTTALGAYTKTYELVTVTPLGTGIAVVTTKVYGGTGSKIHGCSTYITDEYLFYAYTVMNLSINVSTGVETWTPEKRVIGGFTRSGTAIGTVEYAQVPATPSLTYQLVPGSGEFYTPTGWPFPETYYYAVFAANPFARSAVSSFITFTAGYTDPMVLELSWAAVSSATHYIIVCKVGSYYKTVEMTTGTSVTLTTREPHDYGDFVMIDEPNYLMNAIGVYG